MKPDKKHKRVISKGTALYKSGDPSGMIYILEKGEIMLEGGGVQETFKEGEVVGAFDSLLRKEYSKSAYAATPCTVTLLSAAEQLGQLKDSLSLKIVSALLSKTDQSEPGYWS